jgi:RND family efflux transporter MFP subunit
VRSARVERAVGAGQTVPAQIYARDRATLSARRAASVAAIPVREGDVVRRGDVLVRLESDALTANAAAARTALDLAESDRRRMEALAGHGVVAPRELEAAQERSAAARASLGAAKDDLAYSIIRAPFPGVVTARRANVGDVISPGQAIVEIESPESFEVRATVEADAAPQLGRGSTVTVDVDSFAGPLTARVRAVSPAGDAVHHRFEMRADLPPAAGMRSGLFARLRLPGGGAEAETHLSVPAAAVVRRGGLAGVFVVKGGKAWLRWVALGAPATDRVEVRAGLDEGERVALAPERLEDGVPVVEES